MAEHIDAMVSKTTLRVSAMATALLLSIGLASMIIAAAPAYAEKCDSSSVPPFKDFPDASGSTGNPHTCQQPTGDPHDDPDNPESGNPHNTP